MPFPIPDPGVAGILTPKVGVDQPLGIAADDDTLTDAFASVQDAPSGGTVTILYSVTAGGGGPNLTVTIADGTLSGSATGTITVNAGDTIYRRISAESGGALTLGGYATLSGAGQAQVPLATLANLKLALEITGVATDSELTLMLNAASTYLEQAMRRTLVLTQATEIYTAAPFPRLTMMEYPLNANFVPTVIEGATTLVAADYRFEGKADGRAPWVLTRLSGGLPAPWAVGDVTVTHQSGFASFPEAITVATLELAMHRWHQRRDSTRAQLGLTSKGPADSSVENYLQILPHVQDVVQQYKRAFG